MKACAREPKDRYRSAGKLAEDLENFLEGRPIKARPPSALETFTKWCRRNPAVAGLSGFAALLLTLVAVLTSIGYARTDAALKRETELRLSTVVEKQRVEIEKQKAEQTLGISLQALDRVYKRFAPDRIGQQSSVTMAGIDGEQLAISSQPMLSKETAVLLEDVLMFYDQFAQQNSDNLDLKKEAAKANRRVGDIHRQLGDFAESTTAYVTAIAMYEEIGDSDLELARIRNALGEVHRNQNEHEKSRDSFFSALELLEPLTTKTSSADEARFETARTLYLLAKRRQNDPVRGSRGPDRPPRDGRPPREDRPPPPRPSRKNPEDIAHIERAVTILEELTRRDSTFPEYQFLLALCYREKSEQETGDDHQRSIDVLVKLCEQYPQVPEYQYELGVTLAEIPMYRIRGTELPDAITSLRLSLQRLNLLTQSHPNIPRYIEAAAHSHHKMGELLLKFEDDSTGLRNGNMEEAKKHLRMAVRLQKSQCDQFPESASEQIWLARMRDNLAISLRGDEPKAALELIEKSITESMRFVTGNDDSIPAVHVLIVQYETEAEILDDLGRHEGADKARREARTLREFLPPPRRP